jgi:hypothetical protein
MNSQPRKCIATKALLALALWGMAALAFAAQVAGTVVNLSGPLLARKENGAVKVLTMRSEVENGDTLISEKNTYARIRFIDDSEVTLRPGTQFRIENFAFEDGKPENDSAVFELIKGGLRSVTGALGHRNKERYGLKTPTATIGIRGTTFIANYIAPPLPAGAARGPAAPNQAPGLPPGLHLQVTDGAIVVTNNGGSQGFQAGQFGYVPNPAQPPIIVPPNPGLQFTPPPAFSAPAGASGKPGDSGKSGNIDCEVR